MSPGGRMFNSRRKRPLEPPSSLTVTTPVSSEMNMPAGGVSPGATVYCFNPFSSVERPVPPPMATTRSPRPGRPLFWALFKESLFKEPWLKKHPSTFILVLGGRQIAGLGVEHLREAWIVCHVLEVGIVLRLEAVLRIQADSVRQMLERAFNLSCKAIQAGETVESKISFGVLLLDFFHVSARLVVLASIHQ